MAAAADASLEERVQRVVEAAVAARRDELEQLVRHRVDVALADLAAELVEAQLAKRCSNCGGMPVVPQRTVCRPCLRARTRELHAARVGSPAERRQGERRRGARAGPGLG